MVTAAALLFGIVAAFVKETSLPTLVMLQVRSILEWLLVQDPQCPLDEETISHFAAEGGNLEVLVWLKEQGLPITEGATETAAREGHLKELMWLRRQDPPVPWSEWACRGAAAGGHLGVLRWLRSQQDPCPWDRGVCEAAVRKALAISGLSSGKHVVWSAE